MYRRRALLVLLVVAACALLPSRVSAHPADMYAQDQTITLLASGLQLEWRILPGPFLADAAWAAADTNHDGLITDDEARAWVAPFMSGLTVSLDSQAVASPSNESIHWPATVEALRTGEDAVVVKLSFGWPSSLAGRHALQIHNAYLESNSLNWFSLTGLGGVAFGRPAQDNGRLTFDLFLPPGAPANALTAWTSGTPDLPDFSASLSSLATKLGSASSAASSASSASTATTGASAVTAALTGLVRNVQLSPYFLLSAFLLSLALGSLHALTPGHGKALVGAYLVGSQGRTRDAVLLGGIVTLTHTGSVLVLGLVTLLASHYILPSLIVPWLELISGILVIVFGLNLLFQRARHHGREHAHPHAHHWNRRLLTGAGDVRNARLHKPAREDSRPSQIRVLQPEVKTELLTLWRAGDEHEYSFPCLPISQSTNPAISSRSLLALGVSGGLVPCPDAIAILLVAVALHRVPFGMLLIVAFSLGLAAVLIAIGIAMVRGVSAVQSSALLSRGDRLARFGAYAPLVSAIVVTGLGAGLTFNAWKSFQFSQTASLGPQAALARIGKQSLAAPANAARASSGSLLYIASDPSGHDQLFMLPRPGATPVQCTQEANGITGYSISPDGGTILYSVFTVDGGSSLWSLHPDSSGAVGAAQKLLDCPTAECNAPVFYPDGSKVVYERLDNTTETTTVPRFSIWWLDLQSGKTQPVFQDAAFPSTAPQFSPNAQWLSYISTATNTLAAFNLRDGRTLSVPLGSQAAIPESWSPDGTALLFGSAIPTASSTSAAVAQRVAGLVHIKVFSLATGQVTDLGGGPNVTDLAAAWSPDGKWIAIDRDVPSSDPSGGSSNQVWLIHPDGSQAHVLLGEAGASYSSLSWSADGRLLLYSRYTLDTSGGIGGTGQFNVCSMDIATGQTTVLAPGGDIAQFVP